MCACACVYVYVFVSARVLYERSDSLATCLVRRQRRAWVGVSLLCRCLVMRGIILHGGMIHRSVEVWLVQRRRLHFKVLYVCRTHRYRNLATRTGTPTASKKNHALKIGTRRWTGRYDLACWNTHTRVLVGCNLPQTHTRTSMYVTYFVRSCRCSQYNSYLTYTYCCTGVQYIHIRSYSVYLYEYSYC